MRNAVAAFLVWTLAALASPTLAAPARPTPPSAARTAPLVVVELFTAQGCSSCLTANDHLDELAAKPGVLALTFSVDYWNYLGWQDSFARPEFVERQRAYVRAFALREVYTPQAVVNGRTQVSAVKPARLDALIAQALRQPIDPPDMLMVSPTRVAVGSGPAPKGGADVWLVRYDPRPAEIQVRRGDNRGQTLTERNVVRELTRLGAWKGRPTAYKLPPAKADGLVTVILVQGVHGGRILGVLKDGEK